MISKELGPPKLFTIYKSIDMDPKWESTAEHYYEIYIKEKGVVLWGFSINEQGDVRIVSDNKRWYEEFFEEENFIKTKIVKSLPKQTDYRKIFAIVFKEDKDHTWL